MYTQLIILKLSKHIIFLCFKGTQCTTGGYQKLYAFSKWQSLASWFSYNCIKLITSVFLWEKLSQFSIYIICTNYQVEPKSTRRLCAKFSDDVHGAVTNLHHGDWSSSHSSFTPWTSTSFRAVPPDIHHCICVRGPCVIGQSESSSKCPCNLGWFGM